MPIIWAIYSRQASKLNSISGVTGSPGLCCFDVIYGTTYKRQLRHYSNYFTIEGEMSTVDTTWLGMPVFIVFRVTTIKSSPLAESADSKDLILTHNNKDHQQNLDLHKEISKKIIFSIKLLIWVFLFVQVRQPERSNFPKEVLFSSRPCGHIDGNKQTD